MSDPESSAQTARRSARHRFTNHAWPSSAAEGKEADGERQQLMPPAVDLLLAIAALIVTALVLHSNGHQPPDWNPLSVLALVLVPITIRYGMAIDARVGTFRISMAPALLFAEVVDGPLTLLPFWSVVAFASHVMFFGSRRGCGRASGEVLSATAMLLVAAKVDWGLWPLDRTIVATLVYLVMTLAIEVVRGGPGSVRRAITGVRNSEVLLFLAAMPAVAGLVALLREAWVASPHFATGFSAGSCLVILAVAQILAARLQVHVRAVETLSRAAAAMPWPSQQIDALAIGFAAEAVRGASVRVQSTPGRPHELCVPLHDHGHLVVTRLRGDQAFNRADQHLLTAIGTMADTSRVQAVQQALLQHRATTDALTGLNTYADLRQRLEVRGADRSDSNQLVVAFIDLDGFKQLNSTIGHLDTDQVLAGLGQRLRQLPRSVDACRFGGDEFVLVEEMDNDDMAVQQFVAAIRRAIEEPLTIADQIVQVQASIGTASSQQVDEDLDEVVRRAEQRMRASKRDRRTPLLRSRERVLEELLGPDGFSVVYQPLVAVQTGEIQGVEALIRVADKTFGQLSPLLVVDAAIRVDLIDDLTRKLLHKAAPVSARLNEQLGRRTLLTINVEFGQLRENNDLITDVLTVIQEQNVDISLELSERAFDGWRDEHSRLARMLQAAGVSLTIDDFGAGYATFALLNQWDWDLVKIDKSLVSGANPAERRLLTHVASMLDDLGKATIAEGIETYDQFELVSQLGIEWVQGWWVAQPLTDRELLELARQTPRLPVHERSAPVTVERSH